VTHAWHLYVARSDRADALEAALADAGVGARGYYRTPVHRQPAMERYATGVELPVTDELARTIIALPMGKDLTNEQVREVARAIVRAS
jgi:dTDP-3-amino-3,4,6-trideoxy-alpha-D-glucose transaminase